MPFQSEKQRRYLHANHPEIAKRWEKEYAHGGILDINESEEITTDDGNDIELTAYNAAFDDPNDLSSGVRTLFMKKGGHAIGGGTIQGEPRGDRTGFRNPHGGGGQYGGGWSPGAGSPGTTSTGGNVNTGGSDRGPRDDPDRFGPTTTTTTTSSTDDGGMGAKETYIQTQYTSPEAIKAKQQRDLKKHVNTWEDKWGKYNSKWDEYYNKYSDTGAGLKKRATLRTEIYNDEKKALQAKYGKSLLQKIALAFLTGGTLSLGLNELKAAKSLYDLEKGFKEDMEGLKGIATTKGYATHHHSVDMPHQVIDQLMIDTFKTRDEDQDEGGSDVVPISTIVESYEQMASQPMSLLGMRDNKALYAALSEKWEKQRREKEQEYKDYGLLPDNAVDNTAVGAITMQANSGGLANLFRVKKQ